MRKIAATIEQTEMGFIARTEDEEVAKAGGTTHLYACGKTAAQAVNKLAGLVSWIMNDEPVDVQAECPAIPSASAPQAEMDRPIAMIRQAEANQRAVMRKRAVREMIERGKNAEGQYVFPIYVTEEGPRLVVARNYALRHGIGEGATAEEAKAVLAYRLATGYDLPIDQIVFEEMEESE